ncbi:MAG: hypothetical protein ABIN24_09360 [Dyadobacter sp.]
MIKQIILLLSLTLMSKLCFGQILVGNVDINRVDSIRIVELYVNRRALKNIVHVYVDFGQRDNLNAMSVGNRSDDLLIVEPLTKKKMVFTSTGAVLNFFERNGWEYINGFAENTGGTAGNYYHFRKRDQK